MPDVDPEEVVNTTNSGITVEKSFEPDDFPVPAIAFAMTSDRDEPVTVRLVDTVPDDIAPENVGFHPKYGAEFWGVDGDEIVFQREFEPDEEYTTVYGLRGGDADAPAKFLSEPSIESVDPPLDGDDTVEIDTSDAAVEDIDVPVGDGETPTEGGSGRVTGVETGAVSGRPEGDVLSTLTAEIEATDHDDPAVSELRDALGIDLSRATVEARLEHLQSAVADLEAYTDALEAFLDENGGAQRVLDDLREEHEETTARLEDLEAVVETTNESLESLDDRFDDEIDELRSDIERMDSDIEVFSGDLSEVLEMRDRLTRALGGIAQGGAIADDDADAPIDSGGTPDTDLVNDSESESDDLAESRDDSNDEDSGDDDSKPADESDDMDDESEDRTDE
ncbi:MAG: hypothetical protein ACQET5_09150 [Halobacteriota archaeon]